MRGRASISFASAAYAAAPRDFASYSAAGIPWLGASPRRTLRGNDGVEHLRLKELPDVTRDELAQIRSFVVHRQQDTFDVELWIQRPTHTTHGADQIGQAFECEVLAMQRNDHRIGSDQRIEREKARVTAGSR